MKPFRHLAFEDRPVRVRGCDSPGCNQPGDFRAPRRRDAPEYYWFCLPHVREYNSNWDYFAGMSPADIEAHIRRSTVGDRPSWPLGEWRQHEQSIRDKAMHEFFGDGFTRANEAPPASPPMSSAERDALAVLELVPPVDLTAIKAQYRLLVKRHHPDANGGSHVAEERFKSITLAFAALREIYEEGEGGA